MTGALLYSFVILLEILRIKSLVSTTLWEPFRRILETGTTKMNFAVNYQPLIKKNADLTFCKQDTLCEKALESRGFSFVIRVYCFASWRVYVANYHVRVEATEYT